MRFIYPALLQRFDDNEVVVTFRDIPECLTSGCDEADALLEAQDALAEAIAGRIDDDKLIPVPSLRADGEHLVAVPTEVAAKAALALACRRSGLSLGDLARLLSIEEEALRRMLDPRHATDAGSIDQALHILGSQIVLEVRDLAPVPSG